MVQPGVGQDPRSSFLDFAALNAVPLTRDPFDFIIVRNFVKPAAFKETASVFPYVPGPGSFPLESLKIGSRFQALLDELDGPDFRQAIERKFGTDLAGRPKITTIRGHARPRDGAIHTDTATKLISVLIYMNEEWSAEGGRLRLLRSSSLEDAVAEIPPAAGTLLAFRRSDVSWHGHAPCEGPRRVIQLNWMTKDEAAAWQRARHVASAAFKKLSRVFSV